MTMANNTPKINPLRLSDLTNDPVLKQFFRRGEDRDPMMASLPAPMPLAPAAREMELA